MHVVGLTDPARARMHDEHRDHDEACSSVMFEGCLDDFLSAQNRDSSRQHQTCNNLKNFPNYPFDQAEHYCTFQNIKYDSARYVDRSFCCGSKIILKKRSSHLQLF